MKKFRKLKLITIGILFVLPLLNSCKKGQDDPFLSLKSRDSRIMRKWNLKKIEGTESKITPYSTSTTTYSYDGSVLKLVKTTDGVTTTTGGTGSYDMTFDKYSKLSYNESFTSSESGSGLEVLTGDNIWNWLNSDKDKSSIFIQGGGTNLFKANIYIVDRLTSKELILKLKYDDSETEEGNTIKSSTDLTYTFEKQ